MGKFDNNKKKKMSKKPLHGQYMLIILPGDYAWIRRRFDLVNISDSVVISNIHGLGVS